MTAGILVYVLRRHRQIRARSDPNTGSQPGDAVVNFAAEMKETADTAQICTDSPLELDGTKKTPELHGEHLRELSGRPTSQRIKIP